MHIAAGIVDTIIVYHLASTEMHMLCSLDQQCPHACILMHRLLPAPIICSLLYMGNTRQYTEMHGQLNGTAKFMQLSWLLCRCLECRYSRPESDTYFVVLTISFIQIMKSSCMKLNVSNGGVSCILHYACMHKNIYTWYYSHPQAFPCTFKKK